MVSRDIARGICEIFVLLMLRKKNTECLFFPSDGISGMDENKSGVWRGLLGKRLTACVCEWTSVFFGLVCCGKKKQLTKEIS